MQYKAVIPATFLERPNRFIAHVQVNGERAVAHVKNTGRCRELLVTGARVYLAVADDPSRKTKYDLIAVEKERNGQAPLLINMDAQAPNAAAEEWLRQGGLFPLGATVRREVRYGDSRFDFYLEHGDRRAFLEVKGVTLEQDGIARFPDAPTERGVKHVKELCRCLVKGYEAYILFVIQMKEVTAFTPNDKTHPAFGDALRAAAAQGVKILAMDCAVTAEGMTLSEAVPVIL